MADNDTPQSPAKSTAGAANTGAEPTTARFDPAEFERAMRETVETINRALPALVPEVAEAVARQREACVYSLVAGGKRLRPLLVMFACEAAGGEADAALPIACAYEFVHTYSLIHDDLPAMDDDDLRRGMPTCHKKFDEATAILAGDALLTQAFEIVARHAPTAEMARDLVIELASASGILGMVGGQAADLRFEKEAPTEAHLLFIHRHKTGALLRSSVRAGAILGGADREAFERLSAYGDALGLAFQVTDDILDVTSTTDTLGKTVGKDATQQKCTYPAVYGLEKSRAIAAELVQRALDATAPFGPHGAKLADLARYVQHRVH